MEQPAPDKRDQGKKSGASLAQKMVQMVEEGNSIQPVDALHLISKIIHALHDLQAGDSGSVHHNLKPENIFVTVDNEIYLLNSDESPESDGQVPQTAVSGNIQLDYLSPEQQEKRPLTVQSNIYSLGVILYELLAGQRPQLPESAWGGTFELKSLPQEVPLENVREGLTPATYAVVRESLRRQPWARYESLPDLAAAVERALADERVAAMARADAPAGRAIPWRIVAYAGIGLIVLVGGFLLLRGRSQTTPSGGNLTESPVSQPEGIQEKNSTPATAVGEVALAANTATAEATATLRATEPAPPPEPTSTTSPTPAPTATFSPTPTPSPEPTPVGMILIPAGAVLMGSVDGPLNEAPEHLVTLDAFFIDQFEISNAQYRNCVDVGECTAPNLRNAYTYANYTFDSAYYNYPVIGVTWDQATTYCQWAGKRLPTEAEWEYAASGPDNLTWPWGNEFDAALSAASARDVQAVDSYPEGISPFGVYNMSGNVVEWVLDIYDESFYANSPAENPLSIGESNLRIYRGGSFGNTDGASSTTSRRYVKDRSFFDLDVGFRCAMDAPQ